MNFNPTDKEINFVNQALEEFNNKAVGPDNHELLYNAVCKAAKKDDEVINFGWCGELNLQNTISALFDGDFGSGYPEKDAERKRKEFE